MDVTPDSPSSGQAPKKPSLFSGWWFLLLVVLVMVAVAARMVYSVRDTLAAKARGDQEYAANVDQDFCIVSKNDIQQSGFNQDAIPALTDPKTVAGADVAEINKKMYGKFLVSGDRVIGVELGGETRAYPLCVLQFHEVVNDTLGGQPILVTYCPWSDSVAVFERDVDGSAMEFGVASDLYKSSLLFYDKHEDGTAGSLWSQLLMKAISGPAAREAKELTPMACQLVHWADWLAAHPDTTVISLETGYGREYGSNPYGPYFDAGITAFPVEPKPEDDSLPLMARIAAVQVTGHWQVYVYDKREQPAADAQPVSWMRDGLSLTRAPHSQAMEPPTLAVTNRMGGPLPVIYSFWFAWYATHPDLPPPIDATAP